MSEPITLYRNGEVLTVTAPSWAKELIANEGWATEPEADGEDVPFSFREVEPEPAVEHVPAKTKRGRPKKAAK